MTIACVECHHEWKKENGKEPQKCAMCHKTLTPQDKKVGATVKCVDCHLKGK